MLNKIGFMAQSITCNLLPKTVALPELEKKGLRVGDPMVILFAEYVDRRSITYRFDGRALTNGAQCRNRRRFDGHIRDQIIKEVEHQCSRSGATFSLRVSGTF